MIQKIREKDMTMDRHEAISGKRVLQGIEPRQYYRRGYNVRDYDNVRVEPKCDRITVN